MKKRSGMWEQVARAVEFDTRPWGPAKLRGTIVGNDKGLIKVIDVAGDTWYSDDITLFRPVRKRITAVHL